MRRFQFLVSAFFSIAGCLAAVSCGNGGNGGGGSTTTNGACMRDKDCDDNISCTIDACNAGTCSHIVGPNSGATGCPVGRFCEPGKGCIASPACATDTDCVQVLAVDACKTNITCDPVTALCVFKPLDKDGDGHSPAVCGGDDCNDADPTIFPGHSEVCDGLDNDCDGTIDNDATCDDPLTSCQSGACACRPENLCNGACVDKQIDPKHCGDCMTSCATGAECVNGVCTCDAPNIVCGNTCIDPTTDDYNCGACGTVCNAGFTCVQGSCACPPGTDACGTDCTQFAIDPLNCGACGNACGASQYCDAGACQCGLIDETPCGSSCANLMNDSQNCGVCGNVCGPNEGCDNGTCTACASLSYCRTCCDLRHSDISKTYQKNLYPQCACLAGAPCNNPCTDPQANICQSPQTPPKVNCDICLENQWTSSMQTCAATALQQCAADPQCAPVTTCFSTCP